MRPPNSQLILLIAICFCTPSLAAPVTWGEPFELVGTSDINLSFGPIVYAQNGGDNIGNEAFIPAATIPTLDNPRTVSIGTTLIDFEGIETIYGDEASFGQIGFPFETFGDAVDHLEGQDFNITFDVRNGRTVNIPQVVFDPTPATLFDPPENDDYSVDTDSTDLDFILDSQVFMDSRSSLGAGETEATAGALEVFLNNLTIGTTYQVQIIGGADDRTFGIDPQGIDPEHMAGTTGNSVSPIGTLSDGQGNLVANVGAFLDLDDDGVGHVTSVLGTFTADSTSQQIDYLLQRGRNVGLSAIILSEAAVVTPGDFNGDGSVDGDDFLSWQRGEVSDPPAAGDLANWEMNYGGGNTLSAVVAVPEPLSIYLSSLPILVFTFLRRRS